VFLEIEPPAYENCTEGYIVDRFTCPRCAGRGWLQDYRAVKDYKQIACSRCAGTGLLRVKVTTDWEAESDKK
jgi:DnaJ-class molecular chaperone